MKSSTCIVGYIDKTDEKITIYMGCDSLVTCGYNKTSGYNKLFVNGQFLFGVTGSVYAAHLLKYVWTQPERHMDQCDDMEYLYQSVIPSIRSLYKESGHMKISNNEECIYEDVMIAFNGKLYVMNGDFCIMESLRNFDSVGCGKDFALGVCYVLQHNKAININKKITLAIEAAGEFSTGVDKNVFLTRMVYK